MSHTPSSAPDRAAWPLLVLLALATERDGFSQGVPITSGPGHKYPAPWGFTPDGSGLLWGSSANPGGLYVTDPRGGSPVLIQMPMFWRDWPLWTKDGRRLAGLFGGLFWDPRQPHGAAIMDPARRSLDILGFIPEPEEPWAMIHFLAETRISPRSDAVLFIRAPFRVAVGQPPLLRTWEIWRTVAPDPATRFRGSVMLRGSEGGEVNNRDPDWSPDGRLISYIRSYPGARYYEACGAIDDVTVMTADGSGQQTILSYTSGCPQWTGWSPRGDLLAWLEADSWGMLVQVVLWDRTSGAIRRVGRPVRRNMFPAKCVWSPDGRFLLVDENTTAGTALYRLDVRTGEEVLVVPAQTPWAAPVAWSPLGDLIAFASAVIGDTHLQIHVLDPGIGVLPAVVGTCEPGTEVRVRLDAFGRGGARYRLALSLSDSPGIPTPLGPVPLAPDALFFASLNQLTVFRNFSGQLDARGRADAYFAVPPRESLRGLRLFAAYVLLDPGGTGITLISRARPFFIP